jgi:hydroxylamine reductase
VKHVSGEDFSEVIARAKALPGFTGSEGVSSTAATLVVGFGHNTVLSVADKLLEAVQTGKVSGIFLIGGCDGHEAERSYYTGRHP